jgi:hypothetical protein
MHKEVRKEYNASFTEERYQAFLRTVHTAFGEPVTFRVAESPVFIPLDLGLQMVEAVNEIVDNVVQPEFIAKCAGAVPAHLDVPNETPHTKFLQLDFGICMENGKLVPRLIEMQGFPSLYFFQHMLGESYRRHFDIPANFHHKFGRITEADYIELMRGLIIGDSHPDNVVLLDIEPEKQNTRIDFWGTRKYTGVKVLCISKVKKEGRDLYYIDDDGKKVGIERIYNRVIFDELDQRTDLPREWDLREEMNAEWVGHPNWFLRLSKYTLPFLKSQYVPDTLFLNELKSIPDDLENWVLKPLYSFSGQGVKINVKREDIESINNPDNFILQKKVNYHPGIETLDPSDPAKCEIRMMLIWNNEWDRPRLVNNLVRFSKGEMVGVRYNMGKDWVGSSVAFFESQSGL